MSELRANTISDAAGTGPVTLTKQSAAKAWVHFDGNPTVVSRSSFNVSGLTDNGTGDYTISFTSSMSSGDDYSLTGCAGQNTTSLRCVCQNRSFAAPAAGSVRVQIARADGDLQDAEAVYGAIHGDLA